jgi:hypothetical protein
MNDLDERENDKCALFKHFTIALYSSPGTNNVFVTLVIPVGVNGILLMKTLADVFVM